MPEPMRSWHREALSHPHDPAGNKAPRVWGPAGNSPWLPSHGVPPAASGGLRVLGQVPSLLWASKAAPVCWLPASFPLPKRFPLPGTSSFPQENLRPAVTSLCLCPILSLTLALASIARVAPPEATGPCGVSWEPYGVSSPEQRGRGEPRLWIQPEPSPALFLLIEQSTARLQSLSVLICKMGGLRILAMGLAYFNQCWFLLPPERAPQQRGCAGGQSLSVS